MVNGKVHQLGLRVSGEAGHVPEEPGGEWGFKCVGIVPCGASELVVK